MIPDSPTDESIKDVLAHLCFKEGWHRYLEGELSISVYWRGQGRDSGTTFVTDYESWRMLLKGKRKPQKCMFKRESRGILYLCGAGRPWGAAGLS